jgi:hypothetical protein
MEEAAQLGVLRVPVLIDGGGTIHLPMIHSRHLVAGEGLPSQQDLLGV